VSHPVCLRALNEVCLPWQFKQRNYGDTDVPQSKPKAAEECKRKKPDGFGGFVCRDEEVKPLLSQAIDGIVGDSPATAAPRTTATPSPVESRKKSIGESTSSSSSKPLTFDELLANSIANKELIQGRSLTDSEKAELSEKLKKLLK